MKLNVFYAFLNKVM